jgi:uncharacterized protein
MKRTSSDLILLDINVLLALAWPNHQFHAAASKRLEAAKERWATCALTELGFIRLSSNPAVIPTATTAAQAARLLAAMAADPRHVYLERLPSPTHSASGFEQVLGSRQVTDAYLLALARRHRAVFVTFDTRLRALAGTETRTEVLGL